MIKQTIDLFQIQEVNYNDRSQCLSVEASGEVKSTKYFPVFTCENGLKKIFKPLSKTKPLSTPLFACSEVFCSYIVNKYFEPNAPTYNLAICKGLTEAQPKYYEKGTLVKSFLKDGQILVNLLEYFRKYPDKNVNIDKYINYCMKMYDYVDIFAADVFSKNSNLSEQLAMQVLLSVFTRNQNFHYENVGFIYENDKILSLAPPIDHEFSSMFLYADDLESYAKINKEYDELLNVSLNSVINKNIKCIVKLHPNLCKKFIESLDLVVEELKKTNFVIQNEEYIGEFNSSDWMVGKALIKDKKPKIASMLKDLTLQNKTDVCFFTYSLSKQFINSGKRLKQTINYYLV